MNTTLVGRIIDAAGYAAIAVVVVAVIVAVAVVLGRDPDPFVDEADWKKW